MKQNRNVWHVRRAHVARAMGVLLVGVALLVYAPASAQGIRRGLSVSAGVLIPSLFPFMVFSCFLSITRYGRLLSVPLRAVTTRVFRLPAELGAVVLLSFVGGYPVGAKVISGLLARGCIDRATAERMLCFCVNSGPAFLYTAVGVGMFYSRQAGQILLAAHTLASLLIGWAVSRRAQIPDASRIRRGEMQGAAAFVEAVSTATGAMLAMCAYAILFSAVLSVLAESRVFAGFAALLQLPEGYIAALVSGALEVTSGCSASAAVGGTAGFALANACLSLCGLSVLFQIFSCFHGQGVRFRGLLLSRMAHAVLTMAVAVPLYRQLADTRTVWLPATPPVLHADGKTALLSACLLGMCTIFLLSVYTHGGRE